MTVPDDAERMQDDLYYMSAAFHEAGHALAALAVGQLDVELELEPYPVCRGRVHHTGRKNFDATKEANRAAIADQIFIAVAGNAAERYYWATKREKDRPRSIQNWQGDIDSAEKFAAELSQDDAERKATIEDQIKRAEDFFFEPQTFVALGAVATAAFKGQRLDHAALVALAPNLMKPSQTQI